MTSNDSASMHNASPASLSERQAQALKRLQHELDHPPFHALFAPQAVSADPDAGVDDKGAPNSAVTNGGELKK